MNLERILMAIPHESLKTLRLSQIKGLPSKQRVKGTHPVAAAKN